MALTRKAGMGLLNEYNKGEFHLKHGQIVGDVMRWYANELGYGDEADFWGRPWVSCTTLTLRCIPTNTASNRRRSCGKRDWMSA